MSDDEELKKREAAKLKGVASKPSFLSSSEQSETSSSATPPSPPISLTSPVNPNAEMNPSIPPISKVSTPASGANSMPVGLPPPPINLSSSIVSDIPSDLDLTFPLPKKSTPGFTDDNVLNYAPAEFFLKDMQIFLYQLYRAFNLRYDMWEETSINLLKILREMNANVEKNAAVMLQYIEYLQKRILDALDKFKHKRNEVIRYANVDYESVIQDFRRTIGLLNLQLRDIHLRQTVDRFANIYLQ